MRKSTRRYLASLNESELEIRLKDLRANCLDENDEEEIKYIENLLDSWWRREGIA